jgi:TPR repeat protein
MGQTYDPAFLGNFVVEGLQPDIEQATKWYQLAAELGSSEAEARLVALNVER